MSCVNRRSPRGERGLKCLDEYKSLKMACRSPRGERGLKLARDLTIVLGAPVAPRVGSVD